MTDAPGKFHQWFIVKMVIAANESRLEKLLNRILTLEDQLLPGAPPTPELETLYQEYEALDSEQENVWLEVQRDFEEQLRGEFYQFDQFLISSKARYN